MIVRLNLVDENFDDPWWGIVGYTLTFLGHSVPRSIFIDAFTGQCFFKLSHKAKDLQFFFCNNNMLMNHERA